MSARSEQNGDDVAEVVAVLPPPAAGMISAHSNQNGDDLAEVVAVLPPPAKGFIDADDNQNGDASLRLSPFCPLRRKA